MRISDLLAQAQDQLKKTGVSNSKLDALILLTHALSVSKEQIIFNPDWIISKPQQEYFFDLVARRCKREPVSQIIGKREFYGYDFIVTADVLDPRPDSESLIELVLQTLSLENSAHAPINFLELGVGSGCLSITLLQLCPNASATGVDISPAALAICQKNAVKNQVHERLFLINSDLFFALDPSKKFDLIISNPPYIKSCDINDLQDEVKNFEPHLALDGGADGLDFYREIAKKAGAFLQNSAHIIIEIGADQKDEIVKIFTAEKFIFIESKKDLAGHDRALSFKLGH